MSEGPRIGTRNGWHSGCLPLGMHPPRQFRSASYSLFLAIGLAGCANRDPSFGPHGTSGRDSSGAGSGGGASAGEPGEGRGGLSGAAAGGRTGSAMDPGDPVSSHEPESVQNERAALQSALLATAELTSAEFLERHRPPFQPAPNYEPAQIAGLSAIQSSVLRLSTEELSDLAERGFAISATRSIPSFLYGYANIYAADLPVYVSADSILYSIHDSYDTILQELEANLLIGELDVLLSGMRSRLAGIAESPAKADADLYLSVAQSLLRGELSPPTAGGDAKLAASLFGKATTASGWEKVVLFGVSRDEDFSQFEPRGHYAGIPTLEKYFRSMIWLGRTDFRLLETQEDGSRVFRREQLDRALVVRELVDPTLQKHFDRIDQVVTAFVGEHDFMQLAELDALLEDLGVGSREELAGVEDEAIVQAIDQGGYGTQRISSHIMINGMQQGTLPLSSSFAFLGQRYVIDSHVFSNVVYDRAGAGAIKRMMPDPLDAAFAALGNDQAAWLLAPELERYPYAPDLGAMRVLADSHPQGFWTGNLYNLWLSALRTLSPDSEALTRSDSGLFPAARSEAWGRRLLSAQLASWAELRHDTILYAKQSYTGGIACEYPDAYVDPYPEFYEKVTAYATHGKDLIARLELPLGTFSRALVDYFDRLASVATRLGEIAEYQRTGATLTPEMMEFINDAVAVEQICGGGFISNQGWYGRLFFNASAALELDPTIADVHTQPTDEVGVPVGRVLHVATGAPRLMAVVAEGCSGPRAYLGLVSSYYERVTENFERITDQEWKSTLFGVEAPADPAWLSPVLSR